MHLTEMVFTASTNAIRFVRSGASPARSSPGFFDARIAKSRTRSGGNRSEVLNSLKRHN